MKPKNAKKLALNKTTVTDLNFSTMSKVLGGLTWTDPRVCNTDYQCSMYQSELYTCPVGCLKCNTITIEPTENTID